MTTEVILKEAAEAKLQAVVIIGIDENKHLFVRSHPDNVMAAYFLLGRGMHEIQNLATEGPEEQQAA